MTVPYQPVINPGVSGYSPSDIPPVAGGAPAAPAPASNAPAAMPVAPPAAPAPVILNGANVPSELRGRTMDEALRIYSALRDSHLRTPAPYQPAPVAPPPRETAAADPATFWKDPQNAMGEEIDRRVRAAMQDVMGPTIASSNYNAAKTARDTVAAQYPMFEQLESKIMEKLQGLPPQTLMSPSAWQNAYYLAYGEASSKNLLPTAPAAAPETAQPPAFAPTYRPPGSFFVEPARGTGNPAGGTLSSDEVSIASKMGMSADQYMSWKGGVRR